MPGHASSHALLRHCPFRPCTHIKPEHALLPLPSSPADVASEVPLLKPGGTLVSFIYPAQNKALVDALAARHMTVLGERRWLGAVGA